MHRLALLVVASIAGCSDGRGSPAWQLAEGQRYLEDAAFRREAMERSLANPKNAYSAQRLASYGLGDRGWDRLPVWLPRSRPFLAADAQAISRGGLPALADHSSPEPIWDGQRPTTTAGWVALGQQVFFGYPLRAEPLAEWVVTRPELAARVGVTPLSDGSYPGLRVITDLDGSLRVGITCALCHSAVEADHAVPGRARRAFDYGAMRLAYHAATGVPVDADLARRMRTWGPGRADITEEDEDPVAIPDLWGLAAQSALTQAGTIRQDESPVALALRQETQLLHANHHRARPPRELALALAFYLRSLEPPANTTPHSPQTARGARVFAQACTGCHDNPVYGGAPLAAEIVGTDPALALGRSRGTGEYRPPALLDLRRRAPYLHDGSVSTLAELFAPDRLRRDYQGGARGPGAIPGHRYGIDLDARDRDALIAFLETL